MNDLQKLLKLAENEIGYQEKNSNYALDNPDANAGKNNFTKYSRDVNSWGLAGCQGQPWCATYQFWLEAKIFGVNKALEHFCMEAKSYQAYNCFCIYDAFERKGKTCSVPKVGALIVFKNSHIGRVIAVKNGRVFTNEGNTSALYGDSNGGTVKNKDYALNDSNIMGYCWMDYGASEVEDYVSDEKITENIFYDRVECFQHWLNTWYQKVLTQYCEGALEEDGIYGPKTRQAAFAVWKDVINRLYGYTLDMKYRDFDDACKNAAGKVIVRKGDGGTLVAILEGILAAKKFYIGNIDAIFGEGLEMSVRNIQKTSGLQVDGVVGRNTWNEVWK